MEGDGRKSERTKRERYGENKEDKPIKKTNRERKMNERPKKKSIQFNENSDLTCKTQNALFYKNIKLVNFFIQISPQKFEF